MPGIPRAVEWVDGSLRLLDQTQLPGRVEYIDCRDHASIYNAIRRLSVRGAPAIGIAAAYGLLLPISEEALTLESLAERAARLKGARPTAVNLAWAVDRMLAHARSAQNIPVSALAEYLLSEARAIHTEDARACRAIGEAGLPLVRERPRLLTHCNAGALAVSELGTALAPIYLAHDEGVPVHVYVDETRPLLQGARLTAWELSRAGIDVTLLTDNMAAHVMAHGLVDAVIVGADRVAANGDVANKIGTLGVAVLCRYFDIPFYVACPWSTVDLATETGQSIEIEARDASEVANFAGSMTAPEGIDVLNPAFDVTPAALVTALVTDRGVIESPDAERLVAANGN